MTFIASKSWQRRIHGAVMMHTGARINLTAEIECQDLQTYMWHFEVDQKLMP